MRLKKALLLSGFISLTFAAGAQEKEQQKTTVPAYKHEIGMDANAFFGQIFELFGGKSNDLNPYLLTYKYKWTPTSAFRSGLTVSFRSLKEGNGTFADTRTDRLMNYAARLGYEWQRKLDNQWHYTFGFDVGAGFSKKDLIIDSGFDVVNSTESGWTIKAGPVGGIWYRFSPKISVGTEATFYYVTQDLKEKKVFSANPQFNSTGKISTENRIGLNGLGNLFVTIQF
ncbi:MAG: hypothetical protein RLZZ628_183 [Bacteroidota bacterium]|jgi:hypothetical protein